MSSNFSTQYNLLNKQFTELSLTETPPITETNKDLSPPTSSDDLKLPQEWYTKGYERFSHLFTAKIDEKSTLQSALVLLYGLLGDYVATIHKKPLLDKLVYSSPDLYKLFGWSHVKELHVPGFENTTLVKASKEIIEGYPDVLTVQFVLHDSFSRQEELFRLGGSLYMHFCDQFRENALIPFSFTNSSETKCAEFGLLATLDGKTIRVHFEFVTSKALDYFSHVDALQYIEDNEMMVLGNHCRMEDWAVASLFKTVEVPQEAASRMEKLLDYIRLGFFPSEEAIALFAHEIGYASSDAQDLLFRRRIVGKTVRETTLELFTIVSLLRQHDPLPFFVRSFAKIAPSDPCELYNIAKLVAEKKLSLEQFFAVVEVMCRITKTVPFAAPQQSRLYDLLDIDEALLSSVISACSNMTKGNARTAPFPIVDNIVLQRCSEPKNTQELLIAIAFALSGYFPDMQRAVLVSFVEILKQAPTTIRPLIVSGIETLFTTLQLPFSRIEQLTTRHIATLLAASPHAICQEAASHLIAKLPQEARKALVIGLAKNNPQLALRCLEGVEEISEEEIVIWTKLFSRKELFFDALVRRQEWRWIHSAPQDALEFYKGLASTQSPLAVVVLIQISLSDCEDQLRNALAKAWAEQPRELRKEYVSHIFHFLLIDEAAKQFPEAFRDALIDIVDHPATPRIVTWVKSSFQRIFVKLEDPVSIVYFTFLYHTLCQEPLSEKVKAAVRTAYLQISNAPESIRNWHSFFISPIASLPSLLQKKQWVQAADLALANTGLANFAQLHEVIDGLANSKSVDIQRLFAIIKKHFLNDPGIWKRGIAACKTHPEEFAKALRQFLDIRSLMREEIVHTVMQEFLSNITPGNISNCSFILQELPDIGIRKGLELAHMLLPHFGSGKVDFNDLFAIFQELKDDEERVPLALELLALSESATHFAQITTIANAIVKNRTVQMNREKALVAFTAFFNAAKRVHPHDPFACQELAPIFRWLFNSQEPLFHHFIVTSLSSSPDRFAQFFTGSVAKAGFSQSNQQLIQKFIATIIDLVESNKNPEIFLSCYIERKSISIQEHYQLADPQLINKLEYSYFSGISFQIKKPFAQIAEFEDSYLRLISSLIRHACVLAKSADTTESSRAVLLNNACFMLHMLIESHPSFAEIPDLLNEHRRAASETSTPHMRMIHALSVHARKANILKDFTPNQQLLDQENLSLANCEKKIAFLKTCKNPKLIEEGILAITKDIAIWQQHQVDIDLGKRHALINDLITLWKISPRKIDTQLVSSLLKNLLFPYPSKCVDDSEHTSTLAVLNAHFELLESYKNSSAAEDYKVCFDLLKTTCTLLNKVNSSQIFANDHETYKGIMRKIFTLIKSQASNVFMIQGCVEVGSTLSMNLLKIPGLTLDIEEEFGLADEWLQEILRIDLKHKGVRERLLNTLTHELAYNPYIVRKLCKTQKTLLDKWLKQFPPYELLQQSVADIKKLRSSALS